MIDHGGDIRLDLHDDLAVLLFDAADLDDDIVDPVRFVRWLGCPRAGHLV